MSRYDGLIIPRSYSEYINKTDAATLSQALQLGGVLDNAPTEDSVKAVKSGGVYDAIAGLENEINGKQDALTFDNVPTEDSDNPVKSNGIYDALAEKQDTLTFDDTPTQNSNNPVKSGGLYTEFNKYLIGHEITTFQRKNEEWGYYIKCGTRCFAHIKLVLQTALPDWGAIATGQAVPPPSTNITIAANGKTGKQNSIYIDTTGYIAQAGDGGMAVGTYIFDFDYIMAG